MIFKGRKLIIATKHKKEIAISPVLERSLNVQCFIDPDFDTDQFGTFTGEIERSHDPLTTIRLKCLTAMEKNNCDLGVASEGSFGSHPTFFFAPANDELLILIDKKNGLEIIARELTTETNLNGSTIFNEKELLKFAHSVHFPSHGLILKKSKTDLSYVRKGITNFSELITSFQFCLSEYGSAFVETDMRAMYNPTRMDLIKKVTEKLVSKIESLCPKCNTPGFSISSSTSGLPCSSCNLPTRSTLLYTYQCVKCAYEEEHKYPHEKLVEDPMYCDFCNP